MLVLFTGEQKIMIAVLVASAMLSIFIVIRRFFKRKNFDK